MVHDDDVMGLMSPAKEMTAPLPYQCIVRKRRRKGLLHFYFHHNEVLDRVSQCPNELKINTAHTASISLICFASTLFNPIMCQTKLNSITSIPKIPILNKKCQVKHRIILKPRREQSVVKKDCRTMAVSNENASDFSSTSTSQLMAVKLLSVEEFIFTTPKPNPSQLISGNHPSSISRHPAPTLPFLHNDIKLLPLRQLALNPKKTMIKEANVAPANLFPRTPEPIVKCQTLNDFVFQTPTAESDSAQIVKEQAACIGS